MRNLLKKHRQFLTVGVVGAFGALTQALLLLFMVEILGLSPVISNTLSAELVILMSFSINNCWTFKKRTGKALWVRLITFNSVVLGSIAIQAVTIWLGTHFIDARLYGGYMAIGIGLGWILNYFLYTRLVWFRPRGTPLG